MRTLVLGVVLAGSAAAQTPERVWVEFRDKAGVSVSDASTLGISPRALARRAKVLPAGRLIDFADLPVAPSYLASLEAAGARIRYVSRWLNAASVEIAPTAIATLRALPGVASVRPVVTARRRPFPASPLPSRGLQKSSATDYGSSLTQVSTLNALPLHQTGVIGMGVLIGMIDDGFNNVHTHAALKGIPIVAEHDFVQGDNDVSIAPGEFADQGMHGAATLSVIAGRDNGTLVGAAYGISAALAKTEVDSVEIVQEEDNYVAGLEWLESLGVDIISSSLGYDDVDPYRQANAGDIFYSMKDGKTATTSRAAVVLASKGVLLVTAMGNEGPWRFDDTWHPMSGVTGSLITPADADSILSVGATYSDGYLAGFSSTGPTADNRVKPEVVAQGTAITVANGSTTNGYLFWQGTSFSTPLTASVAALVLSAHPDATPMQIRNAIMTTARHFDEGTSRTAVYPNNYYGWGIVDARAAALSLGPVISNIPLVQYVEPNGDPTLIVSLRVLSNGPLVDSSFALHYHATADSVFIKVPFVATGTPGLYSVTISVSGPEDTSYVGYVTVAESGGPILRRPLATGLFSLQPTTDSMATLFPPQAAPPYPADFALLPNYPNPFNAGTTIVFQSPERLDVELSVYDLLGRRVRTLFRGRAIAGTNIVPWPDIRDDEGRPLASGVYFSRLQTPHGVVTHRMLLLK